MNIKVSVITVCYNAASVIERTIQSVVNQTFKNIEYIIIDGKSSDNTLSVINRYRQYIDLLISEHDNGIYDAMNKGILQSKGDYVIFMNAGDEFVDCKVLERIISMTNDVPLVHGNIIRYFKKCKKRNSGIKNDSPNIMDFLFDTFHHQSCLIKKCLFEKYGLYDTRYKLCSDWKFFFDCVVLNGVPSKYVNINVAKFYMDGVSTKHKNLYLEERRAYLKSIYSDEIYSYLEELYNYRRSRFATFFINLRFKLKNNTTLKLIRKKLY